MTESAQPAGPDLALGVPLDAVSARPLLGHVNGVAVLVSRVNGEISAVAATCTHYGGPLHAGAVADGTVRCPWHHACFSLRTGRALRPPALLDLDRYRVEVRGDRAYIRGHLDEPLGRGTPAVRPRSVVIVGAGAAGNSAAETLRREGYDGPVTLVDSDPTAPCDRPNLSKDYLAGTAQAEWIPLHAASFYEEQDISIRRAHVVSVDPRGRRLGFDDGGGLDYGALVLATGADPIRLPVPNTGTDVYVLRTLADSDAIIAAAANAHRVVVLGASFIGLEVAASLRGRGLEVHVVAPENLPLARALGTELGAFLLALHEERGVIFHLGRSARGFGPRTVVLEDGSSLPADFVVAGVGVRPSTALAEAAGLRMDRGVAVDEFLRTSAPDVFAAGDLVRWPDPHTGRAIRVEHWVVAERMGQTAARNVLGLRERFDAVPFFWSQHYDVAINYVGHAEQWDETVVDGDPAARDCAVTFRAGGRDLATATIFRDAESLDAELAMERRAGAGTPRA